jgi:hypothetical protein
MPASYAAFQIALTASWPLAGTRAHNEREGRVLQSPESGSERGWGPDILVVLSSPGRPLVL